LAKGSPRQPVRPRRFTQNSAVVEQPLCIAALPQQAARPVVSIPEPQTARIKRNAISCAALSPPSYELRAQG